MLVDPERMRAHGVSVDRVMEVTADALDAPLLGHSPGAFVGTGGFVDTPNQRIGVRHVLPVVEPEDLAEVSLETATAGDAARRRRRHRDRPSAARSATPSSTTAPACC